MPEGPSLVMFREELLQFKGKKISVANGTVKTIDPSLMKGLVLKDILTWGKHLLFYFNDELTLRIHFLMFGTFYIGKKREKPPQLHLVFDDKTELNFYTTSMKFIKQPLEDEYDWKKDVMSGKWDIKHVRALIKERSSETVICDLLLDQDIFGGVGNIIKNEALYRVQIHPESTLGEIPPRKLTELLHETVAFAADFLKWRRTKELDANLEVYEQKTCPKHDTKLHKKELGKTKRITYWCDQCQKLYE